MTRQPVLPASLWRRETLVVRPRDLAARYKRPDLEVPRLARNGALRQVATGYWVLPPIDQVGDVDWRPEIEALTLALAVADYGSGATALMGPSAARFHGALPRALAVGTVAIPKQRPALDTTFGRIMFVKRDTDRLRLMRARTALTTGFVTDIEQTMLDIANRPSLGGLTALEATEAIRALALRADWAETLELVREQRLPAAYARARWLADDLLPGDVPAPKPRRPVPSLGLTGRDAARFGIVAD